MKEKICAFIFNNYPTIQLSCNAYNNLISQYLDAGIDIPYSLLNTFHLMKTALHLVKEAMRTAPIKIDGERFNVMKAILIDSEWKKLSFVECSQKHNIDKNTFYRARTVAHKHILLMMTLMFDNFFDIKQLDSCSEIEMYNANAILSFSDELMRISDSNMHDKLKNASSILELLCVYTENDIYSNFIECAISELKKIIPNGYCYSMIAQKTIQAKKIKSKRNMVTYLSSMQEFSGYSYRQTIKMIKSTSFYMGIILFGLNTSFLNDGFCLQLKKQAKSQ